MSTTPSDSLSNRGRSRGLTTCLFLFLLAPGLSAQTANLPPKVAILQPSPDQVFMNPTEIQILVEAADGDGTVTNVEVFTSDGSLGGLAPDPSGSDPVRRLEWFWRNPPAGDHKLVAQATDNEGAVAFSESLVVSVRRDDRPSGATLVIQKPGDGEVFPTTAGVSIELVAVDPAGDIRHVEFFANDVLIGSSDHLSKEAVIPGRPIAHFLEWTPSGSGVYRVVGRAMDSLGNAVESGIVSIIVGPQLPVVSIQATVPETTEPAPNIRVRPGVFTISRTGDVSEPLTVYLAYDGSASAGADYETLPPTVTIPVGDKQVDLLVGPLEDSVVEEVETVVAMLIDPGLDRVPDQIIDPQFNTAKVLINELRLPTNAELVITSPKDGEVFPTGQTVTINATALDPNGYISHVEFSAEANPIGVSDIMFFRAPDPGTPIYHSVEWKNPPAGDHLITARAVDSGGNAVVSKAVFVRVGSDAGVPNVQVAALDNQATEFPPFVDAYDPARFVISRDGDLAGDLYVLFSLHGTAEPDKDYKRPDRLVRIPAGEREVTVEIAPLSDDVAEGMETVALRLEDPTPLSSISVQTPYAMPASTREAAVVIYDQQPPSGGAVGIALPGHGETYEQYQPLPILAAAFHPLEDLYHVDFYAGDQLIGSSDVLPGDFNPGGLLVHRFDWKEPLSGEVVLTARARLSDGTELVSAPIQVVVRGIEKVSSVALLQPQSGSVFAIGETVEITAAARDLEPAEGRLEILIDGTVVASGPKPKVSFSTIATDTPSDVFTLASGPHTLLARTVSDDGTETPSAPIKIFVGSGDTGAGGGGTGWAEVKEIARQPSGNVRLQVGGPVNGVCQLEMSTDLVNWTTVRSVFMPEGELSLEDDPKNGPSHRFYRIRTP